MAEGKPKRPEHVTCGNCAFHHHSRTGWGECRRYAPRASAEISWTSTRDNSWCGDFMAPLMVPQWWEDPPELEDPDFEVKP